MFHHLPLDERETTLSEVRRVLRPGGSFHMLDFAGTKASGYRPFDELGFQRWRHIRTALARHFHSGHRLKGNSEEQILTLMSRAGFISCEKVVEGAMLFGSLRISYYRASAPVLERSTASEPSPGK
jgi:ubiquinone/menaquinone biosynthesis C-methylase UbiE